MKSEFFRNFPLNINEETIFVCPLENVFNSHLDTFPFDLNKQTASHQHMFCAFSLSSVTDGGGMNTSQRISKAMEEDDNSWRAPAFRQKVLAQM